MKEKNYTIVDYYNDDVLALFPEATAYRLDTGDVFALAYLGSGDWVFGFWSAADKRFSRSYMGIVVETFWSIRAYERGCFLRFELDKEAKVLVEFSENVGKSY